MLVCSSSRYSMISSSPIFLSFILWLLGTKHSPNSFGLAVRNMLKNVGPVSNSKSSTLYEPGSVMVPTATASENSSARTFSSSSLL